MYEWRRGGKGSITSRRVERRLMKENNELSSLAILLISLFESDFTKSDLIPTINTPFFFFFPFFFQLFFRFVSFTSFSFLSFCFSFLCASFLTCFFCFCFFLLLWSRFIVCRDSKLMMFDDKNKSFSTDTGVILADVK